MAAKAASPTVIKANAPFAKPVRCQDRIAAANEHLVNGTRCDIIHHRRFDPRNI
jgi:hypothetical protein